ncbi:hypothetical protein AMET1_0523 [Methanonatronarchaeum thermophilum]|uniref:Uncharacterized protein n=1 Tax=Methanonatronarchaeum thermophilum TaxID=1927129 RepID=A0A1Y3GBN9_9EURY|nr:hypothetical protein AMET1_0523 [Methanonatronarchaeum thermophilum]
MDKKGKTKKLIQKIKTTIKNPNKKKGSTKQLEKRRPQK